MSSEDLEQHVVLLTSRDWPTRRAARDALIAAGSAGIAAVLSGLDHAEPLVRRRCLDFLDHHADELCIDDLRRLAQHDPVPQVRRFAVHAFGCVRCKEQPFGEDVIDFLAQIAARREENGKVRREAIYMLGQQPASERVVATLRSVLDQDVDGEVRKAAHRVLRLHDPGYRRMTDERARAASMARAAGR